MKKNKKKQKKNKALDFQIVLFQNKKQIKYIGSYGSIISANKKFYSMLKDNGNIMFPVRFVNTKGIKDVLYELAILKKDDMSNENRLQNELGEYITTTTSSKYDDSVKYGKVNKNKYIIFEKMPYNIEETFWVFGFHPKFQRKNFEFIFRTYISSLKNNKMALNRVICFKNKLLIESNNKLDIVICKNISDCYRLYTELENMSYKNKIKNIIWSGNYKKSSLQYWIAKINSVTNWNYNKIMRNSTRP